MNDVESLADELFRMVEQAQGYAFVSDAEGAGMTTEQFFERVRGRLAWSEESCRLLRKFLREHGQLKAKHHLSLEPYEADKLKIVELERDSLMYRWLRKPDFQRTTAHWPPAKVAGFIESFVSGDLIPALILWQSETSGIFVIDDAHRL